MCGCIRARGWQDRSTYAKREVENLLHPDKPAGRSRMKMFVCGRECGRWKRPRQALETGQWQCLLGVLPVHPFSDRAGNGQPQEDFVQSLGGGNWREPGERGGRIRRRVRIGGRTHTGAPPLSQGTPPRWRDTSEKVEAADPARRWALRTNVASGSQTSGRRGPRRTRGAMCARPFPRRRH